MPTTVCSPKSTVNHMGVSKNSGTPKSSILIGFSIINHPFWGTLIFGNIHIVPNFLVGQLPKPRKFPPWKWSSQVMPCVRLVQKWAELFTVHQEDKTFPHKTTKGNACQSQILDLLILYLSFLEVVFSKKNRTCYVF